MKLILFEDGPEEADVLLTALRGELGEEDNAVRFSSQQDSDTTFEDHLRSEMDSPEYKDASLIIADRDLSRTPNYLGLSETNVRRVASSLAVPVCSYTRRQDPSEYVRAADQREACIAISIGTGLAQCARQIVSIASGFEKIRKQLKAQKESFDKKGSSGSILADILGKPECADKMSLYASGDRHRLHSVLETRGIGDDQRVRRLSCLLGYWLWDSILRYPGVVVNAVAGSSYLNIKREVFEEDDEVRKCFSAAAYDGPFHEAKGPMWWRGALDDILADEEFEDGRSYAESVLNRTIARSECCEESALPAGYYCMLSEKPVGLENSAGGLAWFPRGADLARISNSQHEELGPWLS